MTIDPNNGQHACTREQRLDALRHTAVHDALAYIKLGAPDHAYDRLVESVLGEQARMAGIRVPLHG